METSTPIADPNISGIHQQVTSSASYWSVLYLFGVYEIDKEYAGFDILYFLNFAKSYKSENVAYENVDTSEFGFLSRLIPSRADRLCRMALHKMCVKTNYDVMLTPTYRFESYDIPVLWQEGDVNVRAFASKISGFTVRGRKLHNAYFPNEDNGPKNSFLVKTGNPPPPPHKSEITETIENFLKIIKPAVDTINE